MARKGNSKRRRNSKSRTKQGKRLPQKTQPQDTNAEHFRTFLQWLLPSDCIFRDLKLHGNTSWLPRTLVCLALCWTWAENKNVTDSFTYAVGWCRCVAGGSVLGTYQGMMNALVRWTDSLIPILWRVVHQKMKQIGEDFWETAGWVPIAFDGSRDAAPRTQANEDAFCAPNHGKGKTARYRKKKTKGMRKRKNEKNKAAPPAPQVWITLLWHMGLRLPWTWRLGPSNSSERGHVMEMVGEGKFPKNTLFCGDAGFVGYPLWSLIIEKGFQFLVRVGGNVNLLTEQANCTLTSNMTVLCWPQDAIKLGLPPLRLRLVKIRVGKTWMWLLTSVLNKSKLTLTQIRALYKQRWGIEVEFRGLKQTLDKAKLRCRNEQRVKIELHWSLMGMTIAELFALKEQLSKKRSSATPQVPPPDPNKRSLARTVRAMRFCLAHLKETPAAGETLLDKLRVAVTDDYQRNAPKRARYHPPNPDKKPLGEPKLRRLNAKEKKKLKAIFKKQLLI